MRANARDCNIGALKRKRNFLLVCHVLQFEVGFIAQVSRSFDLLEPIVPLAGHFTVRQDNLGADTSERTGCGDTQSTGCSKDGGVDSTVGVAGAFIIDMQSLQLIESLWHGRELLKVRLGFVYLLQHINFLIINKLIN